MPIGDNGYREGNIFSATFASVAITTAPFDLFGILASTSPIARVEILSIDLAVVSTGLAAGILPSIQLLRGSTASSTSASATVSNLRGWANAQTAGSSVTLPCSNVASTVSSVQIWADSFNLTGGWHYPPFQDDTGLTRAVLASGQRLHGRLSNLSSAMVMSGTVTFREVGGGNAA